MEIVSHMISVPSQADAETLVMPVGDIQWVGDEKEVALKMLQKHLQWGVDRGAYFIGMGDYIDTFSPSNRGRLSQALLYDTAMKGVDKMALDLTDELFLAALSPSKGRWLGLLEGHHYHQFRDGGTSDQYLAQKLDAKFLGSSAYVRLMFASGTRRGSVLIWAHHGVGSGVSIAAPLNKLAPVMRGFEADIYIIGHFTSKDGKPIDRVEPVFRKKGNPPILVHRTKLLVASGGFMKGYVPGARQGSVPRGNYVERGMMLPAALGGPLIRIKPRWKRVAGAEEIWLPDLSVEV